MPMNEADKAETLVRDILKRTAARKHKRQEKTKVAIGFVVGFPTGALVSVALMMT